jgi:transposase
MGRILPRVNDRRVGNGNFRVLRSGARGATCPTSLARASPLRANRVRSALRGSFAVGAQQHPEEITRLVRIGDQIQLRILTGSSELIAHISQS